jgi:hypothetical protein
MSATQRNTFFRALIAALIVANGMTTAILANGTKTTPDPKTSTGRELTGPGAHHGEYIVPRGDSSRVRVDTVHDRRLWLNGDGDTLRDGAAAPLTAPRGSAPTKVQSGRPSQPGPTPGIDDKSSTRPGE